MLTFLRIARLFLPVATIAAIIYTWTHPLMHWESGPHLPPWISAVRTPNQTATFVLIAFELLVGVGLFFVVGNACRNMAKKVRAREDEERGKREEAERVRAERPQRRRSRAWVGVLVVLIGGISLAIVLGQAASRGSGIHLPNGVELPAGWSEKKKSVRVAADDQVSTRTITYYVSPPPLSMEFAYIPAGSFTMGSPASEEGRNEDEVQHVVKVTQPFLLGAYEVTQTQWESLMGTNPSYFQGEQLPVDRVSWLLRHPFLAATRSRRAWRATTELKGWPWVAFRQMLGGYTT
jgi:hypothetical protein